MNLRSALLAHSAAILLAGCATPPAPYQPASNRDQPGYSEIRIEQDRYRVTVTGRSAADSETTEAHARRRAAELTLEAGYVSFQIVRNETFRSEARNAAPLDTFPGPFPFDPFPPAVRRADLRQPSGPVRTVMEFVMSKAPASSSPERIDAARIIEDVVGP